MVGVSLHSYTYLALTFLAILPTSLALPKNAPGSPPSVNITATILDHNGVDVSSSFKIMAYHLPSFNTTATRTRSKHNETEKNLNERMHKTQFAQLANACPPKETFVSSHCDPESGGDLAMQKYAYNCKHIETTYSGVTGRAIGSRPVFRIRDGHCGDDELCVQMNSPLQVAACVKTWLFDDYQIDKDGKVRGMLGGSIFSLDDLKMYAAVSEPDANTAMELSRLEIDASNSPETVDKSAVQSFKCRNCVDLNTDTLHPDTDTLKIQAKLLTSGAAAGILWLGLMSG